MDPLDALQRRVTVTATALHCPDPMSVQGL